MNIRAETNGCGDPMPNFLNESVRGSNWTTPAALTSIQTMPRRSSKNEHAELPRPRSARLNSIRGYGESYTLLTTSRTPVYHTGANRECKPPVIGYGQSQVAACSKMRFRGSYLS